MTAFVVPDSITPIEAWRVWMYAHPNRLMAMHSHVIWPHREALHAQCEAKRYSLFPQSTRDGGHACPCRTLACKCGIHAAETFEDAYKRSNLVSHVVGRVALWGTVVECETGYRAEYAYPLELWVPIERKHPGCAPALEAAYGVPAHKGTPCAS